MPQPTQFTFIPRIGSEIFETSIMKTDECFIFCKTCVENGSTKEEALADMHLIDDLLYASQLHKSQRVFTTRTRAGHLRKNSSLLNVLDDVITGHLNQQHTCNHELNKTDSLSQKTT